MKKYIHILWLLVAISVNTIYSMNHSDSALKSIENSQSIVPLNPVSRQPVNHSGVLLSNISNKDYNSHLRFPCRYEGCSKTFAEKSSVTKHMRIHTGEKSYVCTFEGCSKAFITNGELKKHMLIHTGEKPYACAFEGCKKLFTQSSHLIIHMRTHTRDKPYACTFEGCEKLFSQSNNLKTHMRTHTGETPYMCSMCEMSFGDSSNFNRHMRSCKKDKRQLNVSIVECDNVYTEGEDSDCITIDFGPSIPLTADYWECSMTEKDMIPLSELLNKENEMMTLFDTKEMMVKMHYSETSPVFMETVARSSSTNAYNQFARM